MTLGMMATDVEERIDFEAMRQYKVRRLREQLKKHDLGALLLFDPDNIRYATSTYLNEWASDKFCRWAVFPQEGDPTLFETSTARERKKELCPWLKPNNVRPARRWHRGVYESAALPGLAAAVVEDVKKVLEENRVNKMSLGIDICDSFLYEVFKQSKLRVVPGWQAMWDARIIKSSDELKVIEMAASLVDCVYQEVFDFIRPGVKENEVVGKIYGWLFERGANRISGANCISGPRSNPNSHDFSDRMIRPGDMVFLDIMSHYLGYGTCYYRTFVVTKATKRQREVYKRCLDMLQASIEVVRPGITTADIAAKWPSAIDLGYESEVQAAGIATGHGVGLSIHEKPFINRLVSFEHPTPVEAGMHFALETFYGEGEDGVRIEQQLIVTETGHKIITKWPCDELMVCAPR